MPGVLLITLGVGCLDLPDQISAEELDLNIGTQLTLRQQSLELLPSKTESPEWLLTITEYKAGDSLKAEWRQTLEQETADSVKARETAENSPVGEERVTVPEPIYETVRFEGELTTSSLDIAREISLPTSWPNGATFAGGEKNSLIWLSQAQYEELSQTRHTHVELGLFDRSLSNVVDFADKISGLIESLSGEAIETEIKLDDFTELEAKEDWGTYTFEVYGNKKTVKTIMAENRFAKYAILANPDNPLILEVDLRPLAFGTNFLASLGELGVSTGYKVISIVPISVAPTNVDQPEHQVQ